MSPARAPAAGTSETSAAAFGASTSSHCAPTVCIHVPMLLMSTPAHSHRKPRRARGAHTDESATDGALPDVLSSGPVRVHVVRRYPSRPPMDRPRGPRA